MKRYTIDSAEAMLAFGARIAQALKPGMILALRGDLGVGKTTLTQGLAKGLGIKDAVRSPSYTLIQEYEGRMPLYHMDAYRLRSADDFLDIGAEEYLYGDGVSVIEWSERVASALPSEAASITIEVLEDGSRCLCIDDPYLETTLP